MQDDQTTNLKLAHRRSGTSCSQNHSISSKFARSLTVAAGTNEVAMWALQLYIGLLPKLPLTIPEAHDVHFSNRLQPRDQRPATYITVVSGPLFILSPRGTFFSYHGQVRMRIVTFISYMFMFLILFRYCSLWGIWLFYVQVLDHTLSTSFLQVYTQHWHVVSPAVMHLHFQSHPLILAFRTPISGSAVLTPLFLHLRYRYPVAFLPT
jgi:hypothetical protein